MEASGGQRKVIMPRRFQGRISTVRAGTLTVLVIVVGVFLAFTKTLPWQQPFEFNAVFQTGNNLRLDSPVRIAGVNVGKVTKVERAKDSDLVKVTMTLDDAGQPLHKDATAMIRSRIFLEGNFFVDLRPGTPGSPLIDDGDTLAVTQTATPVQLDQLLTALQTNDREYLQDLLKGFGDALVRKPTAADDSQQDVIVKGLSASQALNRSLDYSPNALKHGSETTAALLGTQPHDLSKLVKGLAKVTTALSLNEEQLKDLITNFNRFFAIFAAEEGNVSKTVRLLAPTLEQAHNSFVNLNEALPQIAGFARDIIPGVQETPATITAVTPWLTQAQRLFSKNELGGLLHCSPPGDLQLCGRDQRVIRPLEADEPHEPVLQRGHPAFRQGRARRRHRFQRRPELQGVLVHGCRARRRIAELRGQRLLHPHRDRRRRRPDQDGQALRPSEESRCPLRQRARPAEGDATCATVEGAADQDECRLLQEPEA